MSILFGHPGGAPHSHNAALAHFEAGRLEAFCVPWMPTPRQMMLLKRLPGLSRWASRLARRSFGPLLKAPRIEGRIGEWLRLAKRVVVGNRASVEALAYEANDWLMRTMKRECSRPLVTAVHSYEDCSLWQFEEAKRRGKFCIYDMPIGYYPAWRETEWKLAREFADWLPQGGLGSHKFARPEQKVTEMELADLVIVPSRFVEKTITAFVDKRCAFAPYGVDSSFWRPAQQPNSNRSLRFIYAGQLSIRKGTPVLLEAWRQAQLNDAELYLVGPWLLADNMRRRLGPNVKHIAPCSREELLAHYQSADVFVFASFFEGFGLVLLEAMACGLPAIASDATAAPDIIDKTMGRVVPAGDVNAWTESLREIAEHRDELDSMRKAAREKACRCTWERYRKAVSLAVEPFC